MKQCLPERVERRGTGPPERKQKKSRGQGNLKKGVGVPGGRRRLGHSKAPCLRSKSNGEADSDTQMVRNWGKSAGTGWHLHVREGRDRKEGTMGRRMKGGSEGKGLPRGETLVRDCNQQCGKTRMFYFKRICRGENGSGGEGVLPNRYLLTGVSKHRRNQEKDQKRAESKRGINLKYGMNEKGKPVQKGR